ncbi:MAG: PBSX family phage terminase large subunit [Pikeienuella sp.]
MTTLDIPTPRWAVPLHATETQSGALVRYKGAWGGRGSGKSHEFAGDVVEEMIADQDCSVVCIREVQKSLALSAKKLIEAKIIEFGVSHMFEVLKNEIRRIGGKGMCIFVGMQDHTADSVKSLEGFRIAWVEEAQSLSQRSMDLLRPTIRAEGSQIWFSWNPRRRGDAVERLLRGPKGPRSDAIVVRANYTDNPFLPDTLRKEAGNDLENDPDGFAHTWLGEYENVGSKVVIPAAWVQSAIGLAEDLGIEVTGKAYAALDVAGGEDGGDENALAIRKGISLQSVEAWNGLDTSLTTNKAAVAAKARGVKEVYYDSIGVGEGVTGEWASMGRRGDQPQGMTMHPWAGGAAVLDPDKRIEPDNPQSPLNKDQYQNMKAQAWFSLRKRFENAHKAKRGKPHDAEMLISIPRDLPNISQIEEELTQPQHKTSGTGKTMVDKQPDNARSPNLADAINMAFFPAAGASLTYAGAL